MTGKNASPTGVGTRQRGAVPTARRYLSARTSCGLRRLDSVEAQMAPRRTVMLRWPRNSEWQPTTSIVERTHRGRHSVVEPTRRGRQSKLRPVSANVRRQICARLSHTAVRKITRADATCQGELAMPTPKAAPGTRSRVSSADLSHGAVVRDKVKGFGHRVRHKEGRTMRQRQHRAASERPQR